MNFATLKHKPLNIAVNSQPHVLLLTWIQVSVLQLRHLTWVLLKKWVYRYRHTHTHTTEAQNSCYFLKCSSYTYSRHWSWQEQGCVSARVIPSKVRHQKSSTTQISLVIQIVKTITLVSSNSLWSLSALVFSKSRLCSSSLMRACSSLVCVC